MSQSKLTPGATPSRRLNMNEFIRERKKKLDDNHTNLIIKEIALKKDLENAREQITLHEGAVLFLNQIIKEWTVYESDTSRLRTSEENARLTIIKEKDAHIEKNKLARKKKIKRKRNGKNHR